MGEAMCCILHHIERHIICVRFPSLCIDHWVNMMVKIMVVSLLYWTVNSFQLGINPWGLCIDIMWIPNSPSPYVLKVSIFFDGPYNYLNRGFSVVFSSTFWREVLILLKTLLGFNLPCLLITFDCTSPVAIGKGVGIK